VKGGRFVVSSFRRFVVSSFGRPVASVSVLRFSGHHHFLPTMAGRSPNHRCSQWLLKTEDFVGWTLQSA